MTDYSEWAYQQRPSEPDNDSNHVHDIHDGSCWCGASEAEILRDEVAELRQLLADVRTAAIHDTGWSAVEARITEKLDG